MNSDSNSKNDSGKEQAPCKDFSQRIPVFQLHDDEEEDTCANEEWMPAKNWLLGNERRGGHAMRTLKLLAPETLRRALFEESNVNQIPLQQLK